MPTSFVPGRNLIFLSFAAALAANRGLGVLVGGMCEADSSGYPDCRADTISAMQKALVPHGENEAGPPVMFGFRGELVQHGVSPSLAPRLASGWDPC